MFKKLRECIRDGFNEVKGFMQTMTNFLGNALKTLEAIQQDIAYLKETIEKLQKKEE